MQEGEARQCITSVRPDTILIIRRQLPEPVAAGRQSRCMWLTVNYAKQQLEQSATERQLCHTHGDSVLREGGGARKLEQAFQSPGQKYDFHLRFVHTHALSHTHIPLELCHNVSILLQKFHRALLSTEPQSETWVCTRCIAEGHRMERLRFPFSFGITITMVHGRVTSLT